MHVGYPCRNVGLSRCSFNVTICILEMLAEMFDSVSVHVRLSYACWRRVKENWSPYVEIR